MTTEKRIFYSICLVSFVGPFLSTSINIAIPVMADQFDTTPDRMSWVVTLFLITTAAFLLPLALSSAAAAFVQTLPLLIGLRAFQGIALAGIYVSYMPLLLATTDESRHGHILGQAVALTYLGLSLGPVIGGALTEFIGWRCIFLLAAALVLLSYLFIRPVRQEWYENGAPFVNAVSPPVPFSAPYTACHPFQTTACSFTPASSFRSSSSFTKGGPFIRSFPFIYFET